jgi:hypothetical protein
MKTTKQQLIEAWNHTQQGIEFKTPFARWIRTHRGMYESACKQYLAQERLDMMRKAVSYS